MRARRRPARRRWDFRCGIVGLPNAGKSTLFNALARSSVAAESYPFCTIEPNVGVVPVPDPRLEALAAIVRPARVVPATLTFVDVAGLVAGASRGEGLGNRFLGHIREVDAIAHVVRCFEAEGVTHVAGRVDPAADIETVDTELMLADLDTVGAGPRAGGEERQGRGDGRRASANRSSPARSAGTSGRGAPPGPSSSTTPGRAVLRDLTLLTAKPVMFVANVAEEDGFDDNPRVEAVRAAAVAEDARVVPICAAIEAELAGLDPEEQLEFLADLGLDAPGLDRFVRAGYELLGLRTFFSADPKEARAWTVRAGAAAPEGAGRIHTDFERGFIRAEVVTCDDFLAHGGEQGAREAGRWRLEGRDYVIAEGDVIRFRFNV